MKNNFNVSRFNKMLSIFGFILIMLALLIIINNPTTGAYEFSIYQEYKWYFWLFLVLAIFIGQIVLIDSAFYEQRSNSWLIGFILIIISNSILLFMPIIRGYFIHGRHDVLTHIGYMIDIENSFYVGSNRYPMIHILSFVASSISDLSYNYITMFIPAFFSLFYIFSWYFLGKIIFEDKRHLFLMLAFSSVLLFGGKNIMMSPHGETLLFTPFFLSIFFKSKTTDKPVMYKIILVLTSFFVTLSHPLIVLLLIITIILSDYPICFNNSKNFTFKGNKSSNLVLILICIFLFWSSYLYLLTRNIQTIVNSIIFDEKASSEYGRYSSSLNSVDIPFSETLKIFLNVYGSSLLLCAVTFVCIIFVFLFWKKHHISIDYYHKFSISGALFFMFLSFFILIFTDQLGFMRIYQYSTFFSFILIPLSINVLLKWADLRGNKYRLKVSSVLLIILVFFTYFSIFNLFYSPLIMNVGQQTSENEFSAMNTFYNVKNNSYPILELGIVNYRIYNAVYGVSKTKEEHVLYNNIIVDHFGYDNNSSLSNYYNKTSYLLISDVGKYQRQKLFPHLESKWNFVQEDFVRLNSDVDVIKFYSDKSLETYIINS